MDASRGEHIKPRKPFVIRKKRHPGTYVAAAVVIVLIVAAAAYALTMAPQTYSVKSNGTLSVAPNSSVYLALSDGRKLSLFVSQASNSSAIVYLSPVPVLGSQVMEFVMYPRSIVNVSTTYSTKADLQLRMLSTSPGAATIEVTSIPSSFEVKVSSDVFFVNSSVRQSITSARNSSVIASTTVATTTTTTTSNAQTSSTTTVQGTSTQQVMSKMNSTSIGLLMLDYSALYFKDRACTASAYNSTYLQQKNTVPKYGDTYYNVTKTVPTGISSTVAQVSGGNYSVTYSLNAPSAQFSGAVVNAVINLSTTALNSVVYEGEWTGLNFSVVTASYNYQSRISGNCGAYIAYVP